MTSFEQLKWYYWWAIGGSSPLPEDIMTPKVFEEKDFFFFDIKDITNRLKSMFTSGSKKEIFIHDRIVRYFLLAYKCKKISSINMR